MTGPAFLVIYPLVALKDQTPVPCSVCGTVFGLPTRDLLAAQEEAEFTWADGRKRRREKPEPVRDWFCSNPCQRAKGEEERIEEEKRYRARLAEKKALETP